MKALLIEFNVNTGQRAGNVSCKDPKLFCAGWQDLKSTPAKEIRMILDNRDTAQYGGTQGVTVLKNEIEIKQAIDIICPPRYSIQEEVLFTEHLKQKGIDLSSYEGQETQEILRKLMEDEKIVGISKQLAREPSAVAAILAAG